jgi:hypothetical protein
MPEAALRQPLLIGAEDYHSAPGPPSKHFRKLLIFHVLMHRKRQPDGIDPAAGAGIAGAPLQGEARSVRGVSDANRSHQGGSFTALCRTAR